MFGCIVGCTALLHHPALPHHHPSQVIQLPNKAATDLKTSTEDISHGQRSLLEGQHVPQAPLPTKEAPADAATPPATAAESARVPYRVPAHSAWFAWDKVHSIEVREVAEFFNDSDPAKTPDRYRAIRNELINLYRRDVHRHLTWTQAKRVVAGDAAALLHVWEFCNRWGLINFQATPVHAAVDAADVVPQGVWMDCCCVGACIGVSMYVWLCLCDLWLSPIPIRATKP